MTTHSAEQQHPATTVSARARRLVRTSLATAALTTGLAIGLAATAGATPEDDFWECVGDHQDTDGIGVCCIFYGGTYDEKTGECWDYPEATVEEADAGPSVPPKHPVVTRVDRLPVYALA